MCGESVPVLEDLPETEPELLDLVAGDHALHLGDEMATGGVPRSIAPYRKRTTARRSSAQSCRCRRTGAAGGAPELSSLHERPQTPHHSATFDFPFVSITVTPLNVAWSAGPTAVAPDVREAIRKSAIDDLRGAYRLTMRLDLLR